MIFACGGCEGCEGCEAEEVQKTEGEQLKEEGLGSEVRSIST